MKSVATIACVMAGALLVSTPATAQSNDDDYTPMNSRIRRDRAFPLEPRNWYQPGDLSRVQKDRSRNLVSIFSKCLWDRSNERALEMLARTDFGFVSFDQIGLKADEAPRRFSFPTCLSRVASYQQSGVMLRFYAAGLRRWLLQEAYFDAYPVNPAWLRPGYVVAERTYPLSANNRAVHVAMDFADCLVTQDPYSADYLFRTVEDSADEKRALDEIMPSLSKCLPQGQQWEMSKADLRVWVGEALWHASQNSAPAPIENSQETPDAQG